MKNDDFVESFSSFSKDIDTYLGKNLFVFDEISSTNIKAKELAQKGETEGTLIISRTQKHGRGRFDRYWESPDGGLYLSIILRPDVSPDKTTLIPLLAALAVSKTIDHFGISSKIKWPNDVRINGKKVAGILLESKINSNSIDYIILGIGINLNVNINQFSKKIKSIATSISHELSKIVDYQMFLKKLLSELSDYYMMFLKGNFDEILTKWKEQTDTLGKNVKIETPAGKIIGKAYDVDRSGFLIVTTNSGTQKKIMSGDCFYLDEL